MKKYLLTGITICLGFISFAQKAVEFKLNPEIGKPLNINMLMKMDVDGPQSIIMDMNMKMEMIPTKQENDNLTIENTTKAIKVDIDAGMMTMSYDSETEATDEMAKMLATQFSKIINQKIGLAMTSKGKTVDVTLPEGFEGQGFDKSSFSNIATAFPDKAVVPGESWESVTEMSDNPIVAKTALVSTYREETADGYVVDVEGKIFDKSENEVGAVSGYYTLDKNTHFTKNSELKTSIEVQGSKIVNDMTLTVD